MKSRVFVSKYAKYFSQDRTARLKELKETYRVDRVFIFPDRLGFTEGKLDELEDIPSAIEQLHQCGMEAGVWINDLGMGNPMSNFAHERCKDYVRLRSVSNTQGDDAFCPMNENFCADYMQYVRTIASFKPDMIMLDDDLTISARPGLGCFCDAHMKLFAEKLGREYTLDELREKIFQGGPTVERDAWLEIMGNTMREFCRKVRQAVNDVDPSIRCGFCSGYTSWDIEGADAIELTKILAGDTKPFLRFTGAPYWSTKDAGRFTNQKLQTAIELSRAQCKWCEGQGIDVFHEADSYPRPTTHVPAAYVECFDIPLVASGGMDRLKYMLDYMNDERYEPTYLKHHLHNIPLCDFIETHFDGKKTVGVQVCQHQYKIQKQVLPAEFMGDRNIACTFFTPDATALVANGIPTTYDVNEEAGVAFGEECRHLQKLPKKLYTDVKGALILQERGFDCGLEDAKEISVPDFEQFDDFKVWYFYKTKAGKYFSCKLKEGAKTESVFTAIDREEIPASYKYAAGGTEFLVLCADAATLHNSADMLYNIPRQKQLMEFFPQYPALKNHPFIYTLVKKDEKETAVLFTNIHDDAIYDGVITLDKEYKELQACGIKAILQGDKILLDETFYPYQSIAFVLK